MRRQILALCAFVFTLTALPATAGIHYVAETTGESQGHRQSTQVEGWVDGPNSKIVFTDTGTPLLKQGSYILTKDAGETIFLVDPKEKTYAEWDLDAMLQSVGSMMEAMGGMIDMQVENVEVEQLESGAGPEMHGLATERRKYRLTYDMKIKVMGMQRQNHVDTVNEVWSTSALDDEALNVWLREAPTTGFESIDALIEAEMSQARGFPLKTVTTTVTTGRKGKRQDTSTTTMVVTSLDRSAAIAPATFEIPEGYERTEVPMAGEEEGGNPLKGLFGGNR